jgi:hypothetical protein
MRWALGPLAAAAGITAAAVVVVVAVPAVAAVPPSPAFESTARFGSWGRGGLLVCNNEWNSAAGPQTIWANSVSSWGIESTQAAGNKVVETYPNVQENFGNVPVSKLGVLRNGYAESMPAGAGLDAEAADDVWLDKYQLEVMIWVDNHGQWPAGKIVGHAVILGQHFSVWNRGATWTFLLDHHQAAGQTHILGTLNWLIARRDIPAGATLAQVGFGWEIASTAGRPMDFKISSYWLNS